MADTLRLFIALPIPQAQKRELLALAGRLPPPPPKTRLAFCTADTLHLTLAFLGETDPKALPALKEGLARLAAGHDPFALLPTHLGGFPAVQNAKIIWLGFAPNPELSRLAQGVGEVVDGLGLVRDAKPFKAHLTLARIKEGALSLANQPPLSAEQKERLRFCAEGFTLFSSQLGSGGARHESLAEFELGSQQGRKPCAETA